MECISHLVSAGHIGSENPSVAVPQCPALVGQCIYYQAAFHCSVETPSALDLNYTSINILDSYFTNSTFIFGRE